MGVPSAVRVRRVCQTHIWTEIRDGSLEDVTLLVYTWS